MVANEIRNAALAACLVGLLGCDSAKTGDPDGFSAAGFAKMEARVTELETKERVRGLVQGLDSVAFLKPAEPEFQSLRTELGHLAVSIANVQDYANGSRVTLNIGNPTAARLQQLSANIEWGRIDQAGDPTGQEFSKSVSLGGSVAPGAWHKVVVNLPDVPSKELGFVRVRDLDYKSISLQVAD